MVVHLVLSLSGGRVTPHNADVHVDRSSQLNGGAAEREPTRTAACGQPLNHPATRLAGAAEGQDRRCVKAVGDHCGCFLERSVLERGSGSSGPSLSHAPRRSPVAQPSSVATTASWTRLSAWSLCSSDMTCFLTVFGDTYSVSAIALFVRPLATRAST